METDKNSTGNNGIGVKWFYQIMNRIKFNGFYFLFFKDTTLNTVIIHYGKSILIPKLLHNNLLFYKVIISHE